MTVQTVYKGYSSFLTVEPGFTGGISATSRRQAAPLEAAPQSSPAAANVTTNDAIATPYRTAPRAHGSMRETGRFHPWEEVDHSRSVWVSQQLDKQSSDQKKGPTADRAQPVTMADVRYASYRYVDTGGVESGEKHLYQDVSLVKDSVRFATTSVDRDVATFDGRQFEMGREGGDPKGVWEAVRDVPMPDIIDTEMNRLNAARSDAAGAADKPTGQSKLNAAEPNMIPGQVTSDLDNSHYTINPEQYRAGKPGGIRRSDKQYSQ